MHVMTHNFINTHSTLGSFSWNNVCDADIHRGLSSATPPYQVLNPQNAVRFGLTVCARPETIPLALWSSLV